MNKNILNNLNKLEETEEVSYKVLFNENFMQKYTNFKSTDELFSKFNISSNEDIKNNIELLNAEINSNSKFSTWEEMKISAGKEHIKKKISNLFK